MKPMLVLNSFPPSVKLIGVSHYAQLLVMLSNDGSLIELKDASEVGEALFWVHLRGHFQGLLSCWTTIKRASPL